MAEPPENEITAQERAIEGYAKKTDFIVLLILGGTNPKTLQSWYPDITDADIKRAEAKIQRMRE
jgi:hypothetical protein